MRLTQGTAKPCVIRVTRGHPAAQESQGPVGLRSDNLHAAQRKRANVLPLQILAAHLNRLRPDVYDFLAAVAIAATAVLR